MVRPIEKPKGEKISIKIYKDTWGKLLDKRRKNLQIHKSYQRTGKPMPLFVISEHIEELIKKDLKDNISEDKREIIGTSLFFENPSLWKSVKNHCKNQGMTITKYLENLIKMDLN